MWDFFSTVRHRHSVRQYRDTPVETSKLHAILEMAIAAPSAGDMQAYHIHAVTDSSQRVRLAEAAGDQQFITQAPVCLVFSTDPQRSASQYGERGQQLYCVQDATIAATYAQLAAVAAGLGSTWVGSFDKEQVRALLQLPQTLEPIAMLTLGYAAEVPDPTPRRGIKDMVSFP